MKPSDFAKASPMGSILKKTEAEVVARNIIVILERTGNTWRKLTFEEYKTERLKDTSFTSLEESYFNQVIDYCVSPQTAKLFAPGWKEVAEKVK